MGAACNRWHLVCKLTACVHVLQSVVVPCALGLHRSSVSLVLGSHAWLANDSPVDNIGIDRRAAYRCVLPERACVVGAGTGIDREILRRSPPARGERPRRTAGPRKPHLCVRHYFRISPYTAHTPNHLWQSFRFGISRNAILGVVSTKPPAGSVLIRPRTPELDAHNFLGSAWSPSASAA